MKRNFSQIGMLSLSLALMADLLFAQEKPETASKVFTDSLTAAPRRAASTTHFITRDDLRHSPIRNLSDLLALQNGIIKQDGALHVRGGRAGQMAYFVDGAYATNAFFNNADFTFIPEAVQVIQTHTGAYAAEYGGANSALVQTVLRTGGPKLEATLDYRTDDFVKPGEQFLNTSSFGFRNILLTLGGPAPLIPNLRFFLAAQHNYLRNRDLIFLEPFQFDSLRTDEYDGRPGSPLPRPLVFQRNHLPGNWYRNNSIQGTLVYSMKALALRFTGLYTDAQNPLDTNWPNALGNYFRRRRGQEQDRTALASLRATHHLGSAVLCELGVSYSSHSNRKFDPDFGDNWRLYADSLANAKLGYTGFPRRYRGPLYLSTIYGFRFLAGNHPLTTYARDEQSRLEVSFAFTARMNKNWEIKAGGRFDKWTMRLFAVGDISQAMEYLYGVYGSNPPVFPSDRIRRALILQKGQIDNYGYDLEGECVETGIDAPHQPRFGSLYLQNEFVFHNLVANLGLRYERIDLQVPRPRNLLDPPFDPAEPGLIDESNLTKTVPNDYILPRVGLSLLASGQTELFAAYGKYVQMPALRDIYRSPRLFAAAFNWVRFSTVGFTAKPEEATQFEFGARRTIAKKLSLSATYFHKDFPGLLRPGGVFIPPGFQDYYRYAGLFNRDKAQITGVELALTASGIKRWSAQAHYTFSRATGTEADPLILYHFGFNYEPKIYKLDYNRTHNFDIIADYRFGSNEGGKIFSGFGVKAVLNYLSGHPFTRIKALYESLGLSNAWEIGVYPLEEPRVYFPISEINAFNLPSSTTIDLRVSKLFNFTDWTVECYIDALNLFNNKATANVYPQTGRTHDGWLNGDVAAHFDSIPHYTDFYKAVNDANHWAYSQVTGKDLFGPPRQVRAGIRLDL